MTLLFLIGLSLTVAGIVFLVGLATRSFVIMFDYFGLTHYGMIFVGLFLMAFDRISKQKSGEGFWKMKHGRE